MATNIMIVDDNEMIRETVEILFKYNGLHIITADGCDACLRHLEEGFRGIILMDIMMPGKDGWDTIREISERGMYDGNIILMLTGKGEPDGKMEGLQEYVTDYVTKPFDPQSLIDTVTYLAQIQKG